MPRIGPSYWSHLDVHPSVFFPHGLQAGMPHSQGRICCTGTMIMHRNIFEATMIIHRHFHGLQMSTVYADN